MNERPEQPSPPTFELRWLILLTKILTLSASHSHPGVIQTAITIIILRILWGN